jgi:hypothetical protein
MKFTKTLITLAITRWWSPAPPPWPTSPVGVSLSLTGPALRPGYSDRQNQIKLCSPPPSAARSWNWSSCSTTPPIRDQAAVNERQALRHRRQGRHHLWRKSVADAQSPSYPMAAVRRAKTATGATVRLRPPPCWRPARNRSWTFRLPQGFEQRHDPRRWSSTDEKARGSRPSASWATPTPMARGWLKDFMGPRLEKNWHQGHRRRGALCPLRHQRDGRRRSSSRRPTRMRC